MESWQLKQKQSLPLEAKIIHTLNVIRQWYEHWDGNVYVSFSGGKDSTVMAHLVRSLYPDVPLVFCDTGLEYPEIKDFVKTFNNVATVRPKMAFTQVIEKYGYPVIGKEVADTISQVRKNKINGKYTYRVKKLNGELVDKNGKKSCFNQEKWKFLLDAPFKIAGDCCNVMKKSPVKHYEKETGRKPFIGTMTDESFLRKSAYLKAGGCNLFGSKRATSKPLSIWTEQDVLQYIKQNNIEIAKVYGEVVYAEVIGDEGYLQQTMFETEKLITTGVSRTGCMFCMFGVHLEKGENRFQRMKRTHPKLYNYCINKLGIGEVLDFIKVHY